MEQHRICPSCGYYMSYIKILHDEFDYPIREKPYYECFECGLCLPEDYDFEEDNFDEELNKGEF